MKALLIIGGVLAAAVGGWYFFIRKDENGETVTIAEPPQGATLTPAQSQQVAPAVKGAPRDGEGKATASPIAESAQTAQAPPHPRASDITTVEHAPDTSESSHAPLVPRTVPPAVNPNTHPDRASGATLTPIAHARG